MEDGVVEASEEGTPQGGLVSPVLANIYLHYVLDLWFEKRFKRSCKGKAHLVRYADDFIACFEREEDASRYLSEMTERLATFDLEIEPSKTACLRFGDRASRDRRKGDKGNPMTFNFLGFMHFVGKSRRGKFLVGRKTERKRIGKKLRKLAEQLSILRVKGGKAMVEYVVLHLRGHMQYYGLSGNNRSLQVYFFQALKLLYKWLNLRSQRKSITWEVFNTRIIKVMPRPHIVHNLYLRNL
jgi:hypothetical protein